MQMIGICTVIPELRRACALDFAIVIWLTTASLAG